jgi:hypothetical protein
MNLELQLLKKIYWYKPTNIQLIKLPPNLLETYLSLEFYDIPHVVDDTISEVQVELKLPTGDQTMMWHPMISGNIMMNKQVSVIGYSMFYLLSKNMNKTKLSKIMKDYAKRFIDYYKPSKVVTSTALGVELFIAYEALQQKVPLELLTRKDYRQWSCQVLESNWMKEHKEMLAELLSSVCDIKEIDSSQLRKIHAMTNCDIAFVQKAPNGKATNMSRFLVRSARSNNIPLVWFNLEGRKAQ